MKKFRFADKPLVGSQRVSLVLVDIYSILWGHSEFIRHYLRILQAALASGLPLQPDVVVSFVQRSRSLHIARLGWDKLFKSFDHDNLGIPVARYEREYRDVVKAVDALMIRLRESGAAIPNSHDLEDMAALSSRLLSLLALHIGPLLTEIDNVLSRAGKFSNPVIDRDKAVVKYVRRLKKSLSEPVLRELPGHYYTLYVIWSVWRKLVTLVGKDALDESIVGRMTLLNDKVNATLKAARQLLKLLSEAESQAHTC